MRVFIVDPHPIYRGGLTACLTASAEVEAVDEAASPELALLHPALPQSDVVLLDPTGSDAHGFIRRVADHGAQVVVLTDRHDEADMLGAIQAGAVGYLDKQSLTPDALNAGVRAAVTGAGVMTPEALGRLLRGLSRVSREVLEPRGISLSRLSVREQQVLRLVADGHPTREVARQLCYSERTVKNVIHDVVTKLNARTRSQAVAEAVREGLI